MTEAEQQILTEAERLRAENERLKDYKRLYQLLCDAINEDMSECDPECDGNGHTETCRHTSASALIEDRQAEIERLRAALEELNHMLGMHESSAAELAAAKAREEKVREDVAALRGLLRCFHADKAPSFGDPNSVKAFKLVWEKLNKLETFKEVK